ncbi:MAG: hypothetical protein MRZ86_03560 [Acidaminococcus sp.]|nr:hypothetical protein [Acidaminococcus sp.]MDD7398772.1 hypothetical protein [Bacillota bacterium]MDY4558969.1 hypothetical protein [Eubacteriales bacterium]MDY5345876.1 hypothetical protein [Eubacteriales bacterium]
MLTVNFVDDVKKTFNGDSMRWVAGGNIIDLIEELSDWYKLDPNSLVDFRYLVNGKEVPQKKWGKIKLKPRDGIMIMPKNFTPVVPED